MSLQSPDTGDQKPENHPMQIHHFENLEVWKRGSRLAVDVCSAAAPSKNYVLKDQITRFLMTLPLHPLTPPTFGLSPLVSGL
jgi:hypothetical protein